MELIINDFSMTGQFVCYEEFEEYFIETLKDVLDVIEKKKIPLYKISDMLIRPIVADMTLAQILRKKSNTAAMYILKKKIGQLMDNPYLDGEHIRTKENVVYEYPGKCGEPNCFTEAIERACPLISFKHVDYKEPSFACKKDEQGILLPNICTKSDLLEWYLKNVPEDIQYIVEEYPFFPKVVFAKVGQRCYAEEAILENELTSDDIQKIFRHIPDMMHDLLTGNKTHWWDSIERDIFEYRVSISESREFRILLFWKKNLYFLNGFIKKTGSTPEREKVKARNIVAEIKRT